MPKLWSLFLCLALLSHLGHLQDDNDEEEEVVFSLQQRRGEDDEGEVWPSGNLVEVGFQKKFSLGLHLVAVGFKRDDKNKHVPSV